MSCAESCVCIVFLFFTLLCKCGRGLTDSWTGGLVSDMTASLTERRLTWADEGWLAAGLFPRQRGLISSLFVAGFTGCGIIFYILERIFVDLGSSQCAPPLATERTAVCRLAANDM